MEDVTVPEKILRLALYWLSVQKTSNDLADFQGLPPFQMRWVPPLKVLYKDMNHQPGSRWARQKTAIPTLRQRILTMEPPGIRK
jgi:hypothetical protein